MLFHSSALDTFSDFVTAVKSPPVTYKMIGSVFGEG